MTISNGVWMAGMLGDPGLTPKCSVNLSGSDLTLSEDRA
jgi:hypothetical protein